MKPCLHVHVKLPFVFLQTAFAWQLWTPSPHSFTSRDKMKRKYHETETRAKFHSDCLKMNGIIYLRNPSN